MTYVYPEDRPERPRLRFRALAASAQLAIALGLLYLVEVGLALVSDSDWIVRWLGLWADVLGWRTPYQLFSYALVHNFASPLHVVLNALALYFFGLVVESNRGPKTVVFLFAAGVLAGGFAFLLLEIARDGGAAPLIGASAGVYALIAAAAAIAPNMETIFRMPLWVLAAIYVGMDVVSFLTSLRYAGGSSSVAYVAHLGGAAAGLLLALRGVSDTRLEFGPFSSLRGRYARWSEGRRAEAVRKREHRLDEILAKIHDRGIGALTPEETRFLKSASRERQGEESEPRPRSAAPLGASSDDR